MRYIPWNEEVAKVTYEYYDKLAKDKNQKYGWFNNKSNSSVWSSVAECLVESYYNKPLHFGTKSDGGVDFELDDAIVDVKSRNISCFNFKDKCT